MFKRMRSDGVQVGKLSAKGGLSKKVHACEVIVELGSIEMNGSGEFCSVFDCVMNNGTKGM